LALATFLVWQLRTGACGVGAYGFWCYRMPPQKIKTDLKTGFKNINLAQMEKLNLE